MHRLRRTLMSVALSLGLLSACSWHDAYPPALPAQSPLTHDNSPLIPVLPPPPDLAYKEPLRKPSRLVPLDSDWTLWKPRPITKHICRGRGKARRCTPAASASVQQAQALALVRPTRQHMGNGQSVLITYTYRPGAIYLVEVAPSAATTLLFPDGERLRMEPVLNETMFTGGRDETPEEDTKNDLIVLRANQAPQQPINVPMMFRSGLIIPLRIVTVEGDPMTLVQWSLPEDPTKAKELPVGERPPKFAGDRAYAGYTINVAGKDEITPPWMPMAVLDDGQNTLIKFARALDWTRAPVVVGLAQNGTPSITPNRYYTRPDAPEEGAWLFVQGLWPALTLKDGAGLTVKIVRQPPAGGTAHAAR